MKTGRSSASALLFAWFIACGGGPAADTDTASDTGTASDPGTATDTGTSSGEPGALLRVPK